MSIGGSPATTEQNSKISLPPWVEKASRANYEFAEKIAKGDMPVYKGPEVADASNMTTDAYKYMMANVGAQDPLYENAAALSGRITELDPRFTEAHNLYRKSAGPFDPNKYLNPYTEEVEKRAISNAERSLTREHMALGDKIRKAGAFGGSTGAIQQGVLGAEGVRGIGDLSAELRRAGYDKATADMFAHRGQMQTAAGGMVSGATQQGQGWMDAARNYLSTAAGRGQQVATDFANMLRGGASEEAKRQQQLDAARAKFYEKRDRPLERLNIRLAALGMSPYGQREQTTGTKTSENPGPDWATMGLGIMQMLPMLSDRRDKKDIEKLGKDEKTGIPIYAYRYKDAPESSPKVVGPMAQDIEKVWPAAVRKVGKHKVVSGAVMGMLTT